MAQLALAGIGAFAGNALIPAGFLGVSGAGIGWTIGGLLGASLQTQKVQGPRLTDLKLTQSAYGQAIPFVFGSPRISGQVIWGSDRREISTTTSRRGKGGPKVKSTTYTYEIDLLLKLTCNPMEGVRRIWINGELQWTAAEDADYGSINASGALATRVTVYRGDSDQLPDPTYEAAVGIGNAPAYRGALTIMFAGLQLGNSGQIPNITVEVLESSNPEVKDEQIWQTPDSPWEGAVGTALVSNNGGTFMAGRWDSGYGTGAVDVYQVSPEGTLLSSSVVSLPIANVATSGSTDEALLATYEQAFGFPGYVVFSDGGRVRVGQKPSRFSKSEGIFVSWNDDTGDLHRYDIDGLRTFPPSALNIAPLRASDSATSVQSMVIRDDLLYLLPSISVSGTYSISVRDLETLAEVDSFSTPSLAAGYWGLCFDDVGALHLVGEVAIWRREGSAWDFVRPVTLGYGMSPAVDYRRGGNSPALVDGVLYVQRTGGASSFGPVSFRASWLALGLGGRPLNEVLEVLCVRAGINSSLIDAAALSGKTVRGYAITPSSTRAVIEALTQAYQFESVCSDSLRFVPLGGAAKGLIPWDDLGTGAGASEPVDALPLSERNDLEMPGFVTIKYMNARNDAQDGTERSSRIATYSDAEQFIELPMLMLPSEAKQAADFTSNVTQASLTTVSDVSVQTKHSLLEPTDVVLLEDYDGSTIRARITKTEWSGGILKITQAVFDNASAAVSEGLTDDDYESSTNIRVPSATIWEYGDWPLFRDEDDNIGYYWAATGAGEFWPGAALLESADDVVYSQVSDMEDQTLIGMMQNVLGSWSGGYLMDQGNVLVVDFGTGVPSSITHAELLQQEKNGFMVGDELLFVRDWSLFSGSTYIGQNLLRGRKGTLWAMGLHQSSETAVLIQPSGIRRVTDSLADLNRDFFYRAVTFGKPLDSAVSRVESNTGVSARPYAPTNLLATRNGTDTTVSWNRRTRLSENWLLGAVPLGEESELWHITRYTDGTYTTVAQEVTSATNSYTFAVAGTVYLSIRQVSARVGEGYPLIGAI